MIVTEEWAKHHYDIFNKKYFNGILPNIPIIINNQAEKVAGRADASGGEYYYKDGVKHYRFTKMLIRMSNYWDYAEEDRIETLLHEMIHIFEYVTNPTPFFEQKNYNAHGEFFQAKAMEINQDGYHIQRFVPGEAIERRTLSKQAEELQNKRKEKGCYVIMFKVNPNRNRPYYGGVMKAPLKGTKDWLFKILNDDFYQDVKLYFTQDDYYVRQKFDGKHFSMLKTEDTLQQRIIDFNMQEVPLPQQEERKPITVVHINDNWDIDGCFYITTPSKQSIENLLQPVLDATGFVDYDVYEVYNAQHVKTNKIRKYDRNKLEINPSYYNTKRDWKNYARIYPNEIKRITNGTLHENKMKPLDKIIKEVVDNFINDDMAQQTNHPRNTKPQKVDISVSIS